MTKFLLKESYSKFYGRTFWNAYEKVFLFFWVKVDSTTSGSKEECEERLDNTLASREKTERVKADCSSQIIEK